MRFAPIGPHNQYRYVVFGRISGEGPVKTAAKTVGKVKKAAKKTGKAPGAASTAMA